MEKIATIIPNWNGQSTLKQCVDSLLMQSIDTAVIIVENGSVDSSDKILSSYGDKITVLKQPKNLGFAGGVNIGLEHALKENFDFIALLNNDAVADKYWLEKLVKQITSDKKIGIVTSKILTSGGHKIDSTGDFYTIWGLPYPRGRGEINSIKYDHDTLIFAASGGASLYRVSMLKEIGLFDEDFFAYYEDVDISFRAQLAGWKVKYVPLAIAYHQIGATSSKIKGFTTYQTIKNLPWVVTKDVPAGLMFMILPRFLLAYFSFVFSATARGQGLYALKGLFMSLVLMPKKLLQRHYIQSSRKVSTKYIDSMLVHDLPPNASKLIKLRSFWWKSTFKK